MKTIIKISISILYKQVYKFIFKRNKNDTISLLFKENKEDIRSFFKLRTLNFLPGISEFFLDWG